MKKALGCIVVSGLATSAFAQSATLSITASAATLDTFGGEAEFTLSIWGDADFGTAIAGGEFALDGTGPEGSVTDMVGSSAPWGALGFQDNGYAGDADYNGMIFGQLIFPPFIPAAPESMLGAGPVLLGTVTVTIEGLTCGVWEWTTTAGSGPFVLEIFTDNGAEGEFTQITDANIAYGGVSINVIPAPASVALLGLGGFVAARRRR